jgi:hypothetical protein
MRYKAMFIAGVAVGFVAGSRAGRDAYDQIAKYAGQIAGHPKVQQARDTVQAKATDLAAKAPDYAKNAASTAVKTAQEQAAQVPGYVSTARQAAQSKIPARFGGTAGAEGVPGQAGPADSSADDVAADGSLIYPAEGGSVNGTRFTPED